MKNRFLTVVCCLLLSAMAMAQKHLEFEGVLVAGKLDVFCEKIAEKGFSQASVNGPLRCFVGDFDQQEVRAVATAAKNEQLIHSFALALPPSTDWQTLLRTFDIYKKRFIKELGTPIKVEEPALKKGDTNEVIMKRVERGKLTYGCQWKVMEGTVDLTIDPTSRDCEGMVVLRYTNQQK